GTNLAFLGANTMYWRIRLEDRRTGRDRLQVGWRSDAALDPVARRHPRLTTARWRDRPHPRPENSLIGMKYECFPVSTDYRIVTPHWWGFRGTHVRRGSRFHSLVGIEADRVYPIRSTPRPLQILAHKKYSCGGVGTSAQSVYYTTKSGAGVFTAGTLRWQCAMGRHCASAVMDVRTRSFVRAVTRNVIRVFAKGPVGDRFPAHDNVARFDLPRVNEVPAS
ncbi:MAG: N,N-dimethylformamidase beta subunit family domain-containing protein, partial [Nocardioidaceae bacterium]